MTTRIDRAELHSLIAAGSVTLVDALPAGGIQGWVDAGLPTESWLAGRDVG